LISNVVTVSITISPATPVPAASPLNICAGSTATLSVASPQQGLVYDWYDSATKINHLFTGSTYTTGPLNANATYYIEATNGSCLSPALGSVQVIMNAVPAAPLVTNSTLAVCSGSAATLSIASQQAGLTYKWYTTATGGTPVFTGVDFITTGLTSGTSYYAEAVNAGGCISASRTPVNITVNALPQVTAQGAAVCPGTAASLTASSTDQNTTINWYSSATGGSILLTGTTVTTPALNTSTTYYAEAVDNATNCVSTTRSPAQVQIIQPLAAPVVAVASTTTSSVTFGWAAVTGATGYQFSTDNGQTFNAPSNGSDDLTQTISNLQPEQSVTIIVRATGNSSCQLSGTSTGVTGVAASPLGDQIFVPNAFTPNGDGKNDIMYVRSENIKSLKFYVYDQWGELLYTSTNQSNGWDGTYKGTKEPVGVYVYYVEAIMNDGHQVDKKGTITLLR
jgi:gliding motility-associated-like protein